MLRPRPVPPAVSKHISIYGDDPLSGSQHTSPSGERRFLTEWCIELELEIVVGNSDSSIRHNDPYHRSFRKGVMAIGVNLTGNIPSAGEFQAVAEDVHYDSLYGPGRAVEKPIPRRDLDGYVLYCFNQLCT